MRAEKQFFYIGTLLFVCMRLLFILPLAGSPGGSPPPKEKLLRELAKPGDFELAKTVEWCGLLRVREAVPYLQKILEKDEPYMTTAQTEAIVALGRIGGPGVLELLLPWLPMNDAITALDRLDKDWRKRGQTIKLYEKYRRALLEKIEKGTPKDSRGLDIWREFYSMAAIDPEGLRPICIELLRKGGDDGFFYVYPFFKKHGGDGAVPLILDRIRQSIAAGDNVFSYLERYLDLLDTSSPGWRESQAGLKILDSCTRLLNEARAKYDKNRLGKNPAPTDDKYVNKNSPDFFKYKHAREYMAAFRLMFEFRFPRSAPLMFSLARDKKEFPAVRAMAMYTLGLVAEPDRPEVVKLLLKGVRSSDKYMSIQAANGLCEYGKRRRYRKKLEPMARGVTLELLKKLKTERGEFDHAFTGLIAWGDERVVPPVLAVMEKMSRRNRGLLIDVLAHFHHPDSVDGIIRLYSKAEKWDKDDYIKALAKLKDPNALPFLRSALKDENRRIRATAEWAIYEIKK